MAGIIGSQARVSLPCLPDSTNIPFRIWCNQGMWLTVTQDTQGLMPLAFGGLPKISFNCVMDESLLGHACSKVTECAFWHWVVSDGEALAKLGVLAICYFLGLVRWSSQSWCKLVINSLVQAMDVQETFWVMIVSNGWGTNNLLVWMVPVSPGRKNYGGYYMTRHLLACCAALLCGKHKTRNCGMRQKTLIV